MRHRGTRQSGRAIAARTRTGGHSVCLVHPDADRDRAAVVGNARGMIFTEKTSERALDSPPTKVEDSAPIVLAENIDCSANYFLESRGLQLSTCGICLLLVAENSRERRRILVVFSGDDELDRHEPWARVKMAAVTAGSRWRWTN